MSPIRSLAPVAVSALVAIAASACLPALPGSPVTPPDCGPNWQTSTDARSALGPPVTDPNTYVLWEDLRAVDSAPDGTTMAVGARRSYQTYHPDDPVVRPTATVWDGTGWASVGGPSFGSIETEFTDVSVLGTDDALAVGNVLRWSVNGSIVTYWRDALVGHWDGATWTQEPAPQGLLVAIDTGDGAAVAVGRTSFSGGAPLVLRRDGGSWSALATPPSDGGTLSLRDVAVVGPDDVWVVGQSIGAALPGYAAHWDGATWQLHSVAGTTLLERVTPRPGGGVDIVGRTSSGQSTLLSGDSSGFSAVTAPGYVSAEAFDPSTVGIAGTWVGGAPDGSDHLWYHDGTQWRDVGSPVSRPDGFARTGDLQLAVDATTTAVRCAADPVYPLPGAPTSVTAVLDGSDALVTWVPGTSMGSDLDSHLVTGTSSRGVQLATSAAGSETTAAIGPLEAGESYTIAVSARNHGGFGPGSETAWVAVPSLPGEGGLPAAPHGVVGRWSAIVSGIGSLEVSWLLPDPGASELTDIMVTATPAVGDPVVEAVGGDDTATTIDDLDATVAWTVSVTAVSDVGASAPSIEVPVS